MKDSISVLFIIAMGLILVAGICMFLETKKADKKVKAALQQVEYYKRQLSNLDSITNR